MLRKFDTHFWETTINTIQEGLMLVSPLGEIIYINKAFERLLGYTLAELHGMTCELFECDLCAKARAEGLEKFCSLFKEGKLRRKECVFLRKDGQPVHLMKSADVIKDENGIIMAGVETLVDLSQIVEVKQVLANLKQQLNHRNGFKKFIGNSSVMRKAFDMAESAAHSDAPVVIHGESGTGKELMAAAIHEISGRSDGPFIKVNCAALNDNLLESELFGHVKGAFTGADFGRIGRFEAANGGSIFLDEIGDLPLGTQTKLLRVLQEKEIEKVGDHQPIKIDTRIITATNKDLTELISDGLFREDLYYRISVIPIITPPLRDRPEDIPLLVESFIRKIGKRSSRKSPVGVSSDAMTMLIAYNWPGNVRELINAIEYACVLCAGGDIIEPQHLPANIRSHNDITPNLLRRAEDKVIKSQYQQIIAALEQSEGSRSQAAKLLGISRVTLWKRMKKLEINYQFSG